MSKRDEDGMGFFPLLVLEFVAVVLKGLQQCHQFTEDFFVLVSHLLKPTYEQRVVPDLHRICTLTHMR